MVGLLFEQLNLKLQRSESKDLWLKAFIFPVAVFSSSGYQGQIKTESNLITSSAKVFKEQEIDLIRNGWNFSILLVNEMFCGA